MSTTPVSTLWEKWSTAAGPGCDDCGHSSGSHCRSCRLCHAPKRNDKRCGCVRFVNAKQDAIEALEDD